MIYICAVEGKISGGPELLHQLAYVLIMIGREAKMVYFKDSFPIEVTTADTADKYRIYCDKSESDLSVIDKADNTVVVPEIAFEFIDKLQYAKKIAWWLSVDNYKDMLKEKYGYSNEDLKDINILDHHGFGKREDVLHLAQSYYALDFLRNTLQVDPKYTDYLSDYINDSYFTADTAGVSINRKDMVIFNPKKGGWRLKKIIDATQPEILWIPLINLTNEKMRLHMMLAKVYVDFGNHPGKDRIPREAAINGCCVITGRQGAAAYHEDVPIPDRYKIDDITDIDTKAVKELILDIFKNYSQRIGDFSEYRDMICSEKERFVTDVIRIFGSSAP